MSMTDNHYSYLVPSQKTITTEHFVLWTKDRGIIWMLIKDMFQKEIERNIRGVIKVAQTDEADIHQELDEYVVTQELHRHFFKLYDNYLKSIDGPTDKMGVWISGF